MSASIGDLLESRRNAAASVGAAPETARQQAPVLAHCLRVTPRSPLPSDFERAVMDTAAHARYDGGCEARLRSRCRWCAIGGGSLLVLALLLALYLPTPWLAAVPAAVAALTGWRWAVYSAAAAELRAEAAG
jgi:hypothetical protein